MPQVQEGRASLEGRAATEARTTLQDGPPCRVVTANPVTLRARWGRGTEEHNCHDPTPGARLVRLSAGQVADHPCLGS